jgi:hypothetical protein
MLDIIGAGFGRTGTLSLKHALEQIGYARCYHMMEVAGNPGHAALWLDVAEGRPVDLDALFEGYRATVDWPSTYYWRELATHYAGARILLSVRDPDRWYESAFETIFRAMTDAPPDALPDALATQIKMARRIVLDETFGGRFEDRDYAISVYLAHNEAVKNAFDAKRLLVYEVGSGWEPLCDFLGVSIPDTEFPRVNDRDSFKARLKD